MPSSRSWSMPRAIASVERFRWVRLCICTAVASARSNAVVDSCSIMLYSSSASSRRPRLYSAVCGRRAPRRAWPSHPNRLLPVRSPTARSLACSPPIKAAWRAARRKRAANRSCGADWMSISPQTSTTGGVPGRMPTRRSAGPVRSPTGHVGRVGCGIVGPCLPACLGGTRAVRPDATCSPGPARHIEPGREVTPSAVSKRICWSGRGRSPLHTRTPSRSADDGRY